MNIIKTTHMKLLQKIKTLFTRRQSVYGAKIFTQRSWLDRQVDDAIYKREMMRGIGPSIK